MSNDWEGSRTPPTPSADLFIGHAAIAKTISMITLSAFLLGGEETNEIDRHSSYKIRLTPVPWLADMRPVRDERTNQIVSLEPLLRRILSKL